MTSTCGSVSARFCKSIGRGYSGNAGFRDSALALSSGLGLRSALRTSKACLLASWADCLAMISRTRPRCRSIDGGRTGRPPSNVIAWKPAASAARELTGVCDLEPPSWHALAKAVRPPSREAEDFDPGCCRDGWQHEAASRVESHFRDSDFFTRIDAAREGPELGWHCPTVPHAGSRRSHPVVHEQSPFADFSSP